jgi:hypothetical protein
MESYGANVSIAIGRRFRNVVEEFP